MTQMNTYLKYIIFILFSVIFLQSCTFYLLPRSIKLTQIDTNNEEVDIPGIEDRIQNVAPGERVNILMVHGMQTHKVNAYDSLVWRIADYMDMKFTWEDVYLTGCQSNDPKLKIYEYELDRRIIRFLFVNWSPATKSYKDRLKAADNQNKRARVNRKNKDAIVNDGFGDVGAMGLDSVQQNVFKVFQLALSLLLIDSEDLTNPPHDGLIVPDQLELSETIIISASLGSKITHEFLTHYSVLLQDQYQLDDRVQIPHYLYKETEDGCKEVCGIDAFNQEQSCTFAESLRTSDYYWYMLSNQLVLLEGIEYNFGIKKETKGFTIDTLCTNEFEFQHVQEKIYKTSEAVASSTQAVSFFDPNDFLGFEIPRDGLKRVNTKPYNISIPIQRLQIFGFANPNKAHTGAIKEPYVIYIMCKGWDGNWKSLPRNLSKKIQQKRNAEID